MAENTHAPSLSQTSIEEDNSSHHSQEHNMNDQSQVLATPSKRPRGRPLGSKNKPKPPFVITQESEDSLKPVVIEIPIGNDIIQTLINFAHHHRVSISLLSGSGSVTEITLRHHVSRASVFPIHGTCRILSLTGSYIRVRLPSLASSNVAFHPCSSFGIIVAGPQGQVYGGVIGGRVIAASVVMVVATVFKNPQFHRFSFINENVIDEEGDEENDENEENEENDNSANVGVTNVDRSGGNNNNGIVMIPNISGFGVANSTGQVPIANMNVMQWNHFNRLPYNY
ncbi:hypothetical protein TanjilG_00746 [Lupinus angustifolius]|uniref:AT-hook motif nuclear-localized protein n=1 Tax=Lupinus angustifolius TaxID=3871 RepID=A0A4P1R8E1_LUPAN|nr:PREDICTED: AT-hook motif nuclear-localized protein 28-like [Lupinus angustifolius]OIW04186.1 hypothetical protein TanjilG_00746 [Lupinus angustifolius]